MSGTQPSSVIGIAYDVAAVTDRLLQLAGQRHGHGLAERPEGAEGVMDGRGFVPAMHHAVAALLVTALPTVLFPGRRLHQFLEARHVAFLEQVARALPAEDVERRVAPRRALVVVLAHQEP